MKRIILTFLIFLSALTSISSYAHAPEHGYIYLRIYENDGVEGRFEILSDDLNKIFDWDLKSKKNNINDITKHAKEIEHYFKKNSAFKSSLGNHNVTFKGYDILSTGLGDYIQILFDLDNFETIPESLDVTYNIAFKESPTHRGFLAIEYNWKAGILNNEKNISLYFTPENNSDTLSLTDFSIFKGFVGMLKQGIWHIWIGIDHIFFLIALILPSVVKRRKEEEITSIMSSWNPVKKFKPAFKYIISIVTFFTIAHTITLSLSALKIISLPGWVVESIIAFSIGLAALHNIRPIFKGRDWIIAFVFGLFHGFGFASVLGDLGLQNEFLAYSLLGFNLGVEIGQLFIILMIFPVLYILRNYKIYPKIIVFGSVFLIVASIYWMIERIFGIDFRVEEFIKYSLYELAVKLGLK